jgi:DNA-binding transcriptional ArsR family regulator
VSGDCDRAELLALLEDEHARAILAETSAEPMSATMLSERCGVSESTIYRRVERLQRCGLLEEHMRFQSDGHHHNVYVSRVESFTVRFEDGAVDIEIVERDLPEEDVADRFTSMWEGL